jgi:hypothetical protein
MRAQLRLREFQMVEARSQIRELIAALEGAEPISPRGVILADRLVRDGNSPMYWPSDDSVEEAVGQARAALHLG